MSGPRNVYVASQLSQDAINEKFQLPAGFVRTIEREKAEFIVFDATDFPEKWVNYVADKPVFYIPPMNLPVLFVALGDLAPEFDVVKKHFNPVEPPVYKTLEELFKAMQWLQSILPFYNQAKRRNIDEATSRATLVARKAQNAYGENEDMLS